MNNINLVPNEYKRAYSRKWFIVLGIVGIIACMMILISLAFIPINKIKEEENKQIVLEEGLKSEKIEQVKDLINKVNAKENEKEKVLLALQEVDVPSPITKEAMDNIVESAPRDLRISTIKIEKLDSKMEITGKARHVKNIAEYIILLHNTKQFQQITYKIEQKDEPEEDGWIDYSIEMQDRILVERINAQEAEESIENEQQSEEIGEEDIL